MNKKDLGLFNLGEPDLTMPFGKYAGSKLSSLPDDYLAWAVGEAEEENFKPQWVNDAIIHEWFRRGKTT